MSVVAAVLFVAVLSYWIFSEKRADWKAELEAAQRQRDRLARELEEERRDRQELARLYYGLEVISPDPNPEEDLEDVTFTGPVFPWVSASQQEHGAPGFES
jgi:hypothetical protein